MYYTGIDRAGRGIHQRIGIAYSDDLYTWTRGSGRPLLGPDPHWYETWTENAWPDEAWRDPWVMRDPSGAGWHMLLTARSASGDVDARGVIGHATSTDLTTWTIQPPLSEPDTGFGQLEVVQVETVQNRPVLVFSCMTAELSDARRAAGETGGVWALNPEHLTGPFEVSNAYRLTDEAFYAGRLIQDRAGDWWLLAFRHTGQDGSFIGQLSDPMPVYWSEDGTLTAATQAATVPADVR